MQKILPTSRLTYLSARNPDEWGVCTKTLRGFELRVDWLQSWDVIRTFLLPHEYAHARVWGRLQIGNEAHDEHFYLELGVVDRAAGTIPPHEVSKP